LQEASSWRIISMRGRIMSTTTAAERRTSVIAMLAFALAWVCVSLAFFSVLALPFGVLPVLLAALVLRALRRREGMALEKGLAVVAIVVVVGAVPAFLVIVPTCQKVAGEHASSIRTSENMRALAIAMHEYLDKYDYAFPPYAVVDEEGNPLLSWRVLILPYLHQNELFEEFHLNEPWDSPHNKNLLAKMPPIYNHPRKRSDDPPFSTHYQVFVGKGAAFEGERGMHHKDFPDGFWQTILIAEAAEPVPWTKPEDLSYDPRGPLPKLGGLFPNGFFVVMADGTGRFIRNDISETTIRALITRNGDEDVGSEWAN
jgi:hypothetical protein